MPILGVMEEGMKQYFVRADWDDEAKCWYVSDTNVPGLCAEGDTLESFQKEVFELVPTLIELNELPTHDFLVNFSHQKLYKHAS